MRLAVLILSAMIVFPKPLDSSSNPSVFIWNVGQGQWITYRRDAICLHLDIGGEFAPWKEIVKFCKKRRQIFAFTHFDQDHVNRLPQFIHYFKNSEACVLISRSQRFSFFKKFPSLAMSFCDQNDLQEIPLRKYSPPFISANSNENSVWYLIENFLLITGDSSQKTERQMLHHFKKNSIQVILLGHHGSRFSTGDNLLRQLPYVRLAIASSRRAKYGHPHPNTIQRLRRRGILIKKTEVLGSIELPIPVEFRANVHL